MEALKFLHILSMFAAVTLLVGTGLFFEVAVRSRGADVATVRHLGRALRPLENLGVGLVIAGIVFGLLTAIVGEFDLTDPWLVIAYVLVAILFVLGPIESAWIGRAVELARAAPDGEPSGALAVAIRDRRRLVISAVSTLLYAVIIFDMVVKPFS